MKTEHIYWIAGFLDGEGSFCYQSGPKIEVTSTDEDLIGKFIRYSNSSSTVSIVKSEQPNRKIAYKTRICGNLAIQWMMTIYPIMCSRRQAKIREVINEWKLAPIVNSNKTKCNMGHALVGKNLFICLNGDRMCRACSRAHGRDYKRRIRSSKRLEKSNAIS